MRLVCISDTHMCHRGHSLPEGDVLIHAGDATNRGTSDEVEHFLDWFESHAHQHKVLIAGNHDWLYQRQPDMAQQLLAAHTGITYLEDSGTEIDGLAFWGSPWQPEFLEWAYNLPRGGDALRKVWAKIPVGTDVLITHGPPHGILDQVDGGQHLGCEELRTRLAAVKPRVHIYGHIHSGYGVAQSSVTTWVNACSCNEVCQLVHRPVVLDITPETIKVHGVEPSGRKQQLEALKVTLEMAKGGPRKKVEAWLQEDYLLALKDMAELRGMTLEALVGDYTHRGLLSDLAKLQRAEAKPSKRLVPFTRLDEH